MLVFLDSNILCTDFYMKGTYFDLLKRASSIVLSEIVIDEVKNKHQEMIKEHVQSLKKTSSELENLYCKGWMSNPLLKQQDSQIIRSRMKRFRGKEHRHRVSRQAA